MSLGLIWARALEFEIGGSDKEKPSLPNLSLRQARVALGIKTFLVLLHIVTCTAVISNVVRHW